MPLKGVDISNWQAGIKPTALGVDFVICKATEGKNFTDKQFKGWMDDLEKAGLLTGLYHFARSNDAASEAQFFYDTIKAYIGKAIPVLDYEVWGQNSNDVAWCEKFIKKFYELSGIYCMIYISASHCSDFKGSFIPEKCGLWVAGYPKAYTSWPDTKVPYTVSPWKTTAIWQFTSSLKLDAWSGNLDGDYAYVDKAGWNAYAGKASSTSGSSNGSSTVTPDYNALANEVIAGKWGNGNERKSRLNTKYGLGTYEKVQAIVNKQLGTSSKPDYEALATQVIRGEWGNGSTRKNMLNAAYGSGTYEKVQAIVNKRLK